MKIKWHSVKEGFQGLPLLPEDFDMLEKIDQTAARKVFKGELNRLNCYVKIYFNPSFFDHVRYVFKTNKACIEYGNCLRLKKIGINVPDPVAFGTFNGKSPSAGLWGTTWGKCRMSGSIFISAEVPGSVTLAEKIKDEPLNYICEFCDFVKDLHAKGVFQKDFHFDNVLLSEGKFFLIDLHRLRFYKDALPYAVSKMNLINVNMFLRECFGKDIQDKFFYRYFGEDFRSNFACIEKGTDESFYHLWKRRDRKAVDKNEDYCFIRDSGFRGVGKREYIEKCGDAFKDIKKLFKTGKKIKEDIKTTITRVNLGDLDLYIKRYNMVNPSRPSGVKAIDSWKGAIGLEIRKINTPEPMLGVKALSGEGYFLSIAENDLERIDCYIREKSLSEYERMDVLSSAARFISDMHNKGIYHRDTKPGNVFVKNINGRIKIFILDTDRVYFKRSVSRLQKIKNIKRLIDNLIGVINGDERKKFIDIYFDSLRNVTCREKQKLKKELSTDPACFTSPRICGANLSAETGLQNKPAGFRKKILIVKPSSLGDIVQTIPAVRCIKKAMPDSKIYWVASDKFKDVVAMVDAVDMIFEIKRKNWGRFLCLPKTIFEIFRFIFKIRSEKIDICIDFQGLFRSGIISWLSGAEIRAGFSDAREFSSLFYNKKCLIGRAEANSAERYISLASIVCGKKEGCVFDLKLPDPSLKQGNLLWSKTGSRGPKVCLIPGARWKSKRWNMENFRKVAFNLRKEVDARIMITGTSEEIECGERIIYGHNKAFNAAGKTNIFTLAGILSLSDLVITNDNGAMHLAAALGKKVICLFGPTSSDRTGPIGKDNYIFKSALPCAPCFSKTCSKGECMTDLLPNEVSLKAVEMLRIGAS